MSDSPKSAKIELPLRNDSEIERLVHAFESLTLPYENWTHRAHLAVAVYYTRTHSFKDALSQIRSRIKAYNLACGDPHGYNETITVMFVKKIAMESRQTLCGLTMHDQVHRLEMLCGVQWLYNYYSPKLIWSPEAKNGWVNPDKSTLDF